MRIIAGKWRGRRLAAAPGSTTRPMLDRAKTVLFDMLGHRLDEPGRLPPLAVLDLFAGSGTLGLEALSRGARYGLFVERDPPAAAALRRNLDALGIISEAGVIQANAAACEFPPPPVCSRKPGAYDLVFVDPPYRLLTGPAPHRSIRGLLERLSTDRAIAPGALVIVRHPARAGQAVDLSPLIELERRNVGRMTLRFMATGRTAAVPDPGEPR